MTFTAGEGGKGGNSEEGFCSAGGAGGILINGEGPDGADTYARGPNWSVAYGGKGYGAGSANGGFNNTFDGRSLRAAPGFVYVEWD